MDKVACTSFISGEPLKLELSSDLSKEVRENICDMTMLVVEEIFHNRHFGRKRDETQAICDLHRFLADYEITTPCKGQFPEQPIQMQAKRKIKFPHEAPVSESLSSAPCRWALPASGTWPTLTASWSNVIRSLHQEG
jgi:hypothetical protein